MKYIVIPQIKHIKLNYCLLCSFSLCELLTMYHCPWHLQYHGLTSNSDKLILSCSSISTILESLFLYSPSRSFTSWCQLSKMVRCSFAPWHRGGFHPARKICFPSKQSLTASHIGKELFLSSASPRALFCQQEVSGRKPHSVQRNVQTPLVPIPPTCNTCIAEEQNIHIFKHL